MNAKWPSIQVDSEILRRRIAVQLALQNLRAQLEEQLARLWKAAA